MKAVHEAEERAAESRPESPAIRRAFLRGHFETRNTAFPVEVDQAIAGAATDHPVIVWAGSEPPQRLEPAPARSVPETERAVRSR